MTSCIDKVIMSQQRFLVSYDLAHLPHRGIDHFWVIRDTNIIRAGRVSQELGPVRCWTFDDFLINDREIQDLRRFDCEYILLMVSIILLSVDLVTILRKSSIELPIAVSPFYEKIISSPPSVLIFDSNRQWR